MTIWHCCNTTPSYHHITSTIETHVSTRTHACKISQRKLGTTTWEEAEGAVSDLGLALAVLVGREPLLLAGGLEDGGGPQQVVHQLERRVHLALGPLKHANGSSGVRAGH